MPRYGQQKPPCGSQVRMGDQLAQGLGGCWLLNESAGMLVNDGVTRAPGAINPSASGPSSTWTPGRKRGVIHHETTSSTTLLVNDNALPTTAITIAMGYRKTDATNRSSGAIGVNTGNDPSRCGVHLPYVDGVVYWDFGGQTAGTSRLSVGGLTFGDDIWVFTAGNSSMAIWQNGVRRASQSASATRTPAGAAWELGTHGTLVSDIADYDFVYFWRRLLTPGEISRVTVDPFSLFQSSRRTYSAPASTGALFRRSLTNRTGSRSDIT